MLSLAEDCFGHDSVLNQPSAEERAVWREWEAIARDEAFGGVLEDNPDDKVWHKLPKIYARL